MFCSLDNHNTAGYSIYDRTISICLQHKELWFTDVSCISTCNVVHVRKITSVVYDLSRGCFPDHPGPPPHTVCPQVCEPSQQCPAYSTCIQYMHTVHGYSTWIQYMDTVHGYSTWIQYMDTVHAYSTCIQYMHTVHGYSTCIQYMDTVHVYTYPLYFNWTSRSL